MWDMRKVKRPGRLRDGWSLSPFAPRKQRHFRGAKDDSPGLRTVAIAACGTATTACGFASTLVERAIRFLRWIVAAAVPRVAPADAPDTSVSPTNRPILPHRFDKVDAATRLEPAALAQRRADQPLIQPDKPDQEQRGDSQQSPQDVGKTVHWALPLQFPLHAPGDPGKRFHERCQGWCRANLGDNDQVDSCRKLGTSRSERLAQQPLPAVANHRPANLARNRKAQPRMWQAIRIAVDNDRQVRGARSAAVCPAEVAGSSNSVPWQESLVHFFLL